MPTGWRGSVDRSQAAGRWSRQSSAAWAGANSTRVTARFARKSTRPW